jgi:hypothetical protein
MRTSGRLAVVLQSIVVSTISACGGAAAGGQPAGTGGGAGLDSGGSAPGGRASGGGGSGSAVQTAGSGGGVLTGAGADGIGVAGAGAAGTEAGGAGAGSANVGDQGIGGSSYRRSMPSCDDQGWHVSFVEGLNLPQPVDFLGVYLNQSLAGPTLYQSTGTPCAGALAQAACQATFASDPPRVGFPPRLVQNTTSPLPNYSYMYVVYTRGDRVGFVSDSAQLNGLLGQIDTANEAGLVFLSMGVAPGCNEIWETGEAYYFTVLSLGAPCAVSPPGIGFSVTHAGEVSSTPVGMAMPCVGRRPHGLLESEATSANPLGDYYASIAHLEGAAVLAFDVIECELARFGAPPDLCERARRARADEVRHVSRMSELAMRWDAEVPCVRAAPSSERSLLAAALENAVEGCVREAWGALSAYYQAATVREPGLQRLWREIAADESEHAELSFALHEWYMQQLTTGERAVVEAALERARLELRAELAFAPVPHAAVVHGAGVPDPACAAALFSQLEMQVLAV